MRLLVYEFVTGGGMLDEPLRPGLVHEADLMVRSLVADLGELPGISGVTTRDPRLAPIAGVETLVPHSGENPFDCYARALTGVDAAWPTAPETGGALERLGRLTLAQGVRLLGSDPDSVRLTASKKATAEWLSARGLPHVPTFSLEQPLPPIAGPWVVKPDDGAGSELTEVVPDQRSARLRLELLGPGFTAQPWLPGKAISLSLLCADGHARILSCNRQRVRVTEGRVSLSGIVVNGEARVAPLLKDLAAQLAKAVPGLWGHVGVDLILMEDGPVILEINPRLTTSYCGLRRALGANPAGWALELSRTGHLPDTPPPENGGSTELVLEGADVV